MGTTQDTAVLFRGIDFYFFGNRSGRAGVILSESKFILHTIPSYERRHYPPPRPRRFHRPPRISQMHGMDRHGAGLLPLGGIADFPRVRRHDAFSLRRGGLYVRPDQR